MKPRGRHPEKALSAIQVKAAKEPGRYGDGNGLYLVVTRSGGKQWVLRIIAQGRRRDIGLGSAQLVSLSDAREKATHLRKLARTGGDPLAEKRKARSIVPTFEEAARLVHKEHSGAWKNAKHGTQWINTLSEYAFPAIGVRRVDQVDTADVLRILSPIWLAKPETARRVRQRLRTVFDWAKAAGHRSGDNPVEGVARGLPRQADKNARHHAALPYSEVPGFVAALRERNGDGEIARLAFEFLILTATRTGEVLGARATEAEGNVWTIPAERMKAGREHRIPLSVRAVEILARAREIGGGGEFLFPSTRSIEKPLSNMVFLMLLRRMGRADITAHGFRSAFRDWASERTNFPHQVAEMALAHAIRDKVEAAYRRGDLFHKRRQMMDAWSAYVGELPGKVIAMRGARHG